MSRQKAEVSDAEWASRWRRVWEAPDHARAERLTEVAARRIQRAVAEYGPLALSWSAGKDSMALEEACRAAGVTEAVLVTSGVHSPLILAQMRDVAPRGFRLTEVHLAEYDMPWLRAHPEMLFPTEVSKSSQWYARLQHTGQDRYVRDRGLSGLILGRRTRDGNYCGPELPGGGRGYLKKGAGWRISPAAEWTWEDVFHVLAHYRRPLPAYYFYKSGFIETASAYPTRFRTNGSYADTWRELRAFDPDLVREAAQQNLPGAAAALTD